jgi:hypothetical protein
LDTSLAATRWPWWIGSNVPPMIPTRRVMAEIVVAIDIPAERSAADSVLDRLVDLAKFDRIRESINHNRAIDLMIEVWRRSFGDQMNTSMKLDFDDPISSSACR